MFSLARGVSGEGPDCHCPKEILGVGPIPARIRGFLILILALSTATIRQAPHATVNSNNPGMNCSTDVAVGQDPIPAAAGAVNRAY
jgi:hypothetical protein